MRSPISVQVSGAPGISPWLLLDYLQRPFNVALMASLSAAAAGVGYRVEYTPDNPNQTRANTNNVVSLTRATTVATLTFTNPHNLVVGDSVVVFGSGDPNLEGNGSVTVASVVSPTVLTYTVANTGLAVASSYTRAIPLRVFPHDFMVALTAKADGNIAFPCWAVRLNVTGLSAGVVTLSVLQGHARG
jgi:hypothetical protein